MPFAPYLHPPEYDAYGVPDAAPDQVAKACRLIDAWLGRPEGLIWSPGADGFPAFMANLAPTASYILASDLVPGAPAVLTVPGARFPGTLAGAAATLDRDDPAAAETCAVLSASGDTLTLESTLFPHAAGASLDFGLTAVEESALLYGDTARLRARPLARIVSVSGSYREGGRPAADAWINGYVTFASPARSPAWNAFPASQCDLDPEAGTCRLLPGSSPWGFSRVRMHVISGWSMANLPYAIKQATAGLVRSAIDTDLPAGMKMMKAGDSAIERFSASGIDTDAQALLAPYRTYRI